MPQRLCISNLFSASSLITDNLPSIKSEIWHNQIHEQQTRELAKIGANFASININNSHVTHSKSKTHHEHLTRLKEVCYCLYELKTMVMIMDQYLVQLYHHICICQSLKIYNTSPWVMQINIPLAWGAIL